MSESVTTPENWRPVPGWDGLYDVSDLGRVRSLPRMTAYGIKGGGVLKAARKGAPRYPYLGVTLSGAGVRRQVKIHRLVLQAFIGPAPEGMNDGRHLDGVTFNCALTNLDWGSHARNGQDMIDHGHANGPGDGSAHPRAKLTEEIAIEARAEYATGRVTERALAKRYGVNVSTMHRLLTRQTWDHV